ncbi:GMC oxidoreductase [Apiospora aurea]|uniref:GMC oxidoreductase n=1 Tax=Apiospora aurea TaxID=335848 RepID=A0ABR1QL47_9PEZI
MSAQTDNNHPHSHIAVPISDPPPATFFDDTQWRVLYALMDTVVPPIAAAAAASGEELVVAVNSDGKSPADNGHQALSKELFESHYQKMQSCMVTPPSREAFAAYLSEKPSEIQDFRNHLVRTLSTISPDARKQLGTVTYLLGTKFGSYALTGHTKPFYELDGEARESVLRSWRGSCITAIRGMAKSLTSIGTKTWVQTSPLFRELSGYVDVPEDYAEKAAAAAAATERPPPPEYVFKQFPAAASETGSGRRGPRHGRRHRGIRVRRRRLRARLGRGGHRVLVVEKGYYFPPSQLPMRSDTAETNLFLNRGVISTDDNSVSAVAGGAWGGGGSVNWGVSLKTPGYVLDDWAANRGLGFFNTPKFQESLERVCDFMGVSDEHAKVTPHNSGGRDHHCGHCHLGCGSGGKQGPAASWLPAAARAGAEFVEGFEVERIDFEDFASGKKAAGVSGKWVSRDADGGTAARSTSGPCGKSR